MNTVKFKYKVSVPLKRLFLLCVDNGIKIVLFVDFPNFMRKGRKWELPRLWALQAIINQIMSRIKGDVKIVYDSRSIEHLPQNVLWQINGALAQWERKGVNIIDVSNKNVEVDEVLMESFINELDRVKENVLPMILSNDRYDMYQPALAKKGVNLEFHRIAFIESLITKQRVLTFHVTREIKQVLQGSLSPPNTWPDSLREKAPGSIALPSVKILLPYIIDGKFIEKWLRYTVVSSRSMFELFFNALGLKKELKACVIVPCILAEEAKTITEFRLGYKVVQVPKKHSHPRIVSYMNQGKRVLMRECLFYHLIFPIYMAAVMSDGSIWAFCAFYNARLNFYHLKYRMELNVPTIEEALKHAREQMEFLIGGINYIEVDEDFSLEKIPAVDVLRIAIPVEMARTELNAVLEGKASPNLRVAIRNVSKKIPKEIKIELYPFALFMPYWYVVTELKREKQKKYDIITVLIPSASKEVVLLLERLPDPALKLRRIDHKYILAKDLKWFSK